MFLASMESTLTEFSHRFRRSVQVLAGAKFELTELRF